MGTSEGSVIGFALVIAKGEQEGKSFAFDASARIGRNDDNDVVLDAPGISREHARVFIRDGRHFAEDLGSINGTKVNGTKIAEPTELAHGDSVAVGQVVFAFVIKGAADPAPPPAEDAPTQMVELLSEEMFTRLPTGMAPPPEAEATAASMPAMLEPPPFDDETASAPPASLPYEEPTFDDRAGVAPPAVPSYDDQTALGMPPPSYDDETTSGKSGGAGGGSAAAIENVETRIGRIPGVLEDPPRAIEHQETRIGAIPAPPVERQETRIFELPNAPGENARPSRVRPAISGEVEPTPIVRRSGVKAALGPGAERRSGVKPALSPTGIERRSGVKAALSAEVTERRSGVKAAMPARAQPQESAVDRARRRREANESLGKMLVFHWRELPQRTRYVLLGSAGAVALGILSAVVIALWPASARGPKGPEPTQLSTQPIADSFGLGEGVTWKRPDLKSFEFFFNTPTRAVALLHYQAKDIGPDEVAISVNGAQAGSVPPDTTNSQEREIEQVLSTRDLKRNARNVVVFDDVHNPPGEDTWQISGLWLEVIPIPELPKDQLLASAREYAARGKLMYEQRDIGSANLFNAWKNYRFAWLTLEAVDEKPELYQLVRYQLAAIGRELDAQCGKMMLATRKAIELHDKRKAKQVLEEVNAYFPTAEHRCHNLALEKANEFDL